MEVLQENDDTKLKPIHMGLGDLAAPTTVFVRKCRWTLGSDTLEANWVKKVSFDFYSQRIKFSAYETYRTGQDDDINIHKWLLATNPNRRLDFTTYDGCGNPIYRYTFVGVWVAADTSDFDYSCSDVSARNVEVTYGSYTREFLANKQEAAKPVKNGFDWSLAIGVEEFPVKVESRPSIDIEETEINFLNAKTWIPGKAAWDSLTITTDVRDMATIHKVLSPGEPSVTPLKLKMHERCTGKCLETWDLVNPWLVSEAHIEDDRWQIVIRYSSVRYESHAAKEGKI